MSSSASPLMFLAHDQWSPRFEKHFFTVRIIAAESHTSAPASEESSSSVPGKNNHPAYYYKIEVSMGHQRKIVHRRYSQFCWLHNQLDPLFAATNDRLSVNATQYDLPPVMPPGSCFCHLQDEKFAKNRMEQLQEFLEDALQRPNVASNESVALFLELS